MNLDFQPNPGELGNFKNLWTNAYNGQKAFFINSSVILYACGSSIRFYNVDTKEIKSFTPPHITADHSNGFCLLTANSAINKFAFSETHLSQPKVFIFDYPSRHEVSKLTDGATIEYLAIEFSNSEVVLTLSGIPELEIIVWNWKSGEKIANIDLDSTLMQPEYIKFSPVNWRSLAVAYSSEIKFYTFEPFDKENVKIKPSRVAMSPINSEKEPKILPDFSEEFVYPTNAITDLDDESGEIIDEILDKREKHVFKALCWTSAEELLVVSKLNYIFKYRLNDSSMVCIYRPKLEDDNALDKRFQIDSSYEMNNLYFHRQAVFASCSDGIVRLLDGSQLIHRKSSVHSDIHVKKIIETSAQFISNVNFNLRHNLLTISTEKGVYVIDSERFLPGIDERAGVLNLNQIQKQSLVVDYDYGPTIAICSLANSKSQCNLVLKETGCLQMWHTKQGQIINRLHLNEECSNMACHPKYPLAVIGTKSGRIIFLDLTDEHVPRIIENCCIHKKQIKLLKFNSSGTLLFSVGDDNKMFIIDVRLNNKVEKYITSIDQRLVTDYIKKSNYENGFYILGYTEFDGEAVSLDVLDYLDESGESSKEKDIISRVALAVHDKSAWEIVRKNIQEIMPSIISPSSPAISDTVSSKSTSSSNITNISAVNSSIAQNILFQNAQMDLVINRSTYSNNEKDVNYDQKSTKQTVKLACKLVVFDLNFNIFSDKVKIYASKRLDLKDDILLKSVFYSHFLFSNIILASRSHVVCSTDRFISKFTLPEYDGTKKASKITYLELNEIVGVHDLGYSYLTKSINNKFIAIGGYDGCVSIRKSSDLKTFIDTKISHFTNGGIELVEFNHDGSSLFILNHDNSLIILNWICNYDLTVKMIREPSVSDPTINPATLKDVVSHFKKSHTENSLTWYEIREKEYFNEQDAQYLPIKKEILNGLAEIKEKLQELMNINTSRDDMSKLKEHEFYLDLDELERLHKETEAEIQKIRDKSEFDNLAKLYVREMIKRECWDNMVVRGRGIQAFNTNLLVENYALKERTRNEISFLERVKTIRRIEISAQKVRNEVAGDLMKNSNVTDLIDMDEDETKEGETVQNNQNNQNAVNNYLSPNLSQLAFKGSIGSLFNGDSNLLYSQFELYTREQKWMQIVLIQDAIYRIKENFNKEFEQIMMRKNNEIAKIREKNQRLKQIYIDLSEEKQLPEPQFGDAENPESLFEVKDDEIKVEKYLTLEQKKQLEEQEAEMNRKRELEKLDNWRERGLMDMMGGVLQIRREDELKKEIPPPPFMDKPEDEWTPEEVKLFKEYEQKIKELSEEREKLKKQLNSEINKINEQILECYQNFDSQLLGLHLRKVKTQQAIYQEELKILRLSNSLIVDSELETYESQINRKLEDLKEDKKDLTQEIQTLKKLIETAREEYEILSAEDKSQEKAFSREFSDVAPAIRDQLLRLYKKRAKNRMHISKTNLNPPHIHVPELGVENPFSDRPTTAQQLIIYDADTEMTLAELDDYDNNAPGGVDRLVWDRFIYSRRQKIALENSLRLKGMAVNDMNLFMQKRIEEDEEKRREIDELSKNSMALQEVRLKAFHNMQIQLLMKQGQVEIDSGPHVHNFESCLLIHRNVVESLNKIIQAHGKQKITIMIDCKDYKKGIRQLEWEHRKMSMTIEDYIQKQRDITYLRLSREVQDYLTNEDYDSKKQKEITVLEQTLAYQAKQFEKVYGLKAKKLREINNQSTKLANQNDNFDDKLVERNVVLHDRKHINQEMTGKTAESIREDKFQQIIQRRKLVDLAKAQAQEVAFLRSEVERLRMKTFPALVQIEF